GVLPLQPQDPQVLLGAQQLEGLVLVVGGQDHLGEDRLHLLGHREGDGTVGGDDAAVGGDRVGAVGALVGEGDVLVLAGHGHAAGVVVLDHGDGREGVVVGGAHGGVGVDVVVVAHLLAAELLGAGEAGGGLVGDGQAGPDRKSTRLNSSHVSISYAVFCLKKKNKNNNTAAWMHKRPET